MTDQHGWLSLHTEHGVRPGRGKAFGKTGQGQSFLPTDLFSLSFGAKGWLGPVFRAGTCGNVDFDRFLEISSYKGRAGVNKVSENTHVGYGMVRYIECSLGIKQGPSIQYARYGIPHILTCYL